MDVEKGGMQIFTRTALFFIKQGCPGECLIAFNLCYFTSATDNYVKQLRLQIVYFKKFVTPFYSDHLMNTGSLAGSIRQTLAQCHQADAPLL